MVYGNGLENRRGGNFTVGSNPTLSATFTNVRELTDFGGRLRAGGRIPPSPPIFYRLRAKPSAGAQHWPRRRFGLANPAGSNWLPSSLPRSNFQHGLADEGAAGHGVEGFCALCEW